MALRRTLIQALFILFATVLWLPAAAAPDNPMSGSFESAEVEGLYLYPTATWLLAAPVAYYKVRGEWPETWSAIVVDELFQVELRSVDGQVIDPDDESFDFNGDAAYLYRGSQNKPLIQTAGSREGMSVRGEEVLDAPYSYAEYLNDFGYEDNQDIYGPLIEQPEYLKLFAIRSMLIYCVGWYSRIHGHVPETWDEFISSGLTPIDENSVNPVTGGPFFGDGRANDFMFESDGEHWYNIEVTDENGDTPWRVNY